MTTTPRFDPRREAGPYTAPIGLYERNRQRPFLGTVRSSHRQLVAGEWTELQLVYEVGGSGLADGSWIKLAFKFYSDWALFQTSDPTAANYVSAEYLPADLVPGQSAATVQDLKVRFDQKGHERPFQKAVIVDVVDGYLNPGDRIVFRLGDRRQGGPGTRAQSFVEKGFQFRIFIDPLGSSKFVEVPGDLSIDIVPGLPETLQLIAPRLVHRSEAFDAIVRVDDAWGNTCRELGGHGELQLCGPDGPVQRIAFELPSSGWAAVRIPSIKLPVAGEWRLSATLAECALTAAVAFVDADADSEGLRPLYADLHVHSDDTVGTNDTLYNLTYGRDVAGLDVLGYTANDFNITQDRWNKAVALIHELNQAGRFVCFPGTEWCGNSSAGGDRNIVFLRDGTPRFPFDDQGRLMRSVEWNEHTAGGLKVGTWPVDDLYAAYADDPEGHLMIPHVGGRRCVLDWHHPQLERLIEVGSAWGQFHWVYAEALQRGYRLGASANSDEHQGRCGGGVPATAVFGTRGGLTGVLAESFDRKAVAVALRQRRTFATTGERTYAALRHGANWMGDVYQANTDEPLRYRVLGDQGWESLELYDGERCIWHRDLHAEAGYSTRRIRLRLGGARLKDRYRGAYWHGLIRVRGAIINDVRGFGFDHPEQTCWRQDAISVGFKTSTSGDRDTIELTLSALAGATIEVDAAIDGYVKVGDARVAQPHPQAPSLRFEVSGHELCDGVARVEHRLPGAELEIAIERVSDAQLPRELQGGIDLKPLNLSASEHPLFLTARQRDQSRIWTSALFVTPTLEPS
jgi:hypothetical protein